MKAFPSTMDLKKQAAAIRLRLLRMIHESGTEGHYGGSLSCVEILTCLYFGILRHRPAQPRWEDRDRFLLSKGHAAPALYAALIEAGYFDEKHLSTFKRLGGILQGHPDMTKTPGVEMSTGSLGLGLSVGVGVALAGRLDRKSYRVYVLLGDGELDEGSVWEAAMAANHYRLGNLVAIIDRNRLQISGCTEDCMQLEPLKEKWEAFGWIVREVDGHDCVQMLAALREVETRDGDNARPAVIIAHTVKGRGIGSLDGRAESHSCALTDDQFRQAVSELERV